MSAPKPDNSAALEFLHLFHPDGPWLLTSIELDRKKIETKTFQPAESKDVLQWLERWNGKRNIYFSVNPPLRSLEKKADKEDMKAMEWLHVDIDPRAGEDVAREQARCLELLTVKLPSGVPAPTCVVFSGGGYQGFWRLAEPMPIDGKLEACHEAERYNRQLELLFGGDHCHNVDRIMRLPGTINLPDAKKVKKGRAPALAALISFDKALRYPLGKFTPAPKVQAPTGDMGMSPGSPIKVQVTSGNVTKLVSVDDLDQYGVPDRVKVIIVQGHDPDNPKARDNSRSAWVFDACCQLVRARVPDEVIFSILLDPDFRISESVRQTGSNAERYALRQIQRAKEEAEEPWLRKLNERHAVIRNWGGRCRVVEEVSDAAFGGRSRLTKQSFDDFRNAYMNIAIKVGEKADGTDILKPLGAYWLCNPARRQYDHLAFAPGREIEGVYNLWRGFTCEARPGDCSLFLTHLLENVCSGNKEWYDYLIRWMARAVQKPDSPGEVCLVLRGKRGTGKSFSAKVLGSLFGRHYLQVSDPKHLVGNFNAHLRDCVILFGDEAFFAGDKKHESVLKTLVTEETLTIEAKGVDVESSPNYCHVILASNERWVVPAGPAERRFFVLDVADGHLQDGGYFAAIAKQLDEGGREALLHHLLGLELNGWDVRQVPKTGALREQQLLSLNADQAWWYNKLARGYLLEDDEEWRPEIMKHLLVADYVEYCRQFNVTRRGNEVLLGIFLKEVCPTGWPRERRRVTAVEVPTGDGFMVSKDARVRFYNFPSLQQCREKWDAQFNSGATSWPALEEQVRIETEAKTPF